jgi:hypothetical protein
MVHPTDASKVALVDFSRVAGEYLLTYTVTHAISGFTLASVPISISVRSNCDTVTLLNYPTVPVLAYPNTATFDLVALTSAMLSQPACILMSLNQKLRFNLQALLYGTARQAVVDSVTNNADYL